MLLVATDRMSAHDVVMAEPIPFKGAVLTQITAWWLNRLSGVKHHMVSANAHEIVRRIPALVPFEEQLAGRAMLSLRAKVYPIECVVRGYLSGSGWKEYRSHGTLAEEPLAPGFLESDKLAQPLFTPATKAESGHDENISRATARERFGPLADELERLSISLYEQGLAIMGQSGLILADTKFEFGERGGQVILIDEVMTPDCSRIWALDSYRPGSTPPSFDKQPLRDYLESERQAGRWNGEAPAPPLPAHVVAATSARYVDAFRRITGRSLDEVLAA